jgi:cell division protein FtsW (lipid II flippase)
MVAVGHDFGWVVAVTLLAIVAAVGWGTVLIMSRTERKHDRYQ